MLGGHHRRHRPYSQEVPLVVDAGDEVEVGHRLGQHRIGAQNPSIRDEQVQPAQAAYHLVGGVELGLFVSHIHPDRDRPATVLSGQPLRFPPGAVEVEVSQHHVGALSQQLLRDPEPETLGGAGDHGYLAGQPPR